MIRQAIPMTTEDVMNSFAQVWGWKLKEFSEQELAEAFKGFKADVVELADDAAEGRPYTFMVGHPDNEDEPCSLGIAVEGEVGILDIADDEGKAPIMPSEQAALHFSAILNEESRYSYKDQIKILESTGLVKEPDLN